MTELISLLIAAGLNFFSYWYSDKIVLKMYRAKEVGPQQAPEVYEIVRTLSTNAGLPMPGLCVIPKEAPNAFATGRDPEHAVICATTGLLQKLNRTELAGVIAHEISHIRHYDIRLMSIVSVLVGSIALLAELKVSFMRWLFSNKFKTKES